MLQKAGNHVTNRNNNSVTRCQNVSVHFSPHSKQRIAGSSWRARQLIRSSEVLLGKCNGDAERSRYDIVSYPGYDTSSSYGPFPRRNMQITCLVGLGRYARS